MVFVRDRKEIDTIAEAARIVAMTLDELERRCVPGVTTAELDRVAEEFIRSHGGRPALDRKSVV